MSTDKVLAKEKPQRGGGKTVQGAALGVGAIESGKPRRGGPKKVRRFG